MSEESAEPAVEQVQEEEVSKEDQQPEQQQQEKTEEHVEEKVDQTEEHVEEKVEQTEEYIEEKIEQVQDQPVEELPKKIESSDVEVAVENKEQMVVEHQEMVQEQNLEEQQEATLEVAQEEQKEQVLEIKEKEEEQPAQEMIVEKSEIQENMQLEIQNEEAEVQKDMQLEVQNIEETKIQVNVQQQLQENEEEPREGSEKSQSSEQSGQADDGETKKEEQEKALEESLDAMQLPLTAAFETALEDEEMPSMVTISSVSRIDDSETNIKQDEEKNFVDIEGSSPDRKPVSSKPPPQDDSDECVVIDSDDDEDEDQINNRRSSRPVDDDDDDDEDEDDDDESRDYSDGYGEGSSSGEYDSEEDMIQRERYERRFSKEAQRRRDEEEDDDEEEYAEDEEDEERRRLEYEEEEGKRRLEYEEDDYGREYEDDATSDDLVLRHSNGLVKEYKERSASLTDLSLIKNSPPKQKPIVNPYSQKVKEDRNHVNPKNRRQPFGHVKSKVKEYIMGIKEQSRMSTERKKNQEESKYKNQEGIEIYRSGEITNLCRASKDYADKALKEIAEYTEKEELYFDKAFGNGEISIFPKNPLADPIGEMEVDPIGLESHKDQERMDKMNGAMQNDNQAYIPERKGILRREGASSKPVLNGEEPSICNLRTLSYDEYMKASSKPNTEDIIAEEEPSKQYDNEQIVRIDTVMSNYLNSEKIDDNYYNRKTPPLMNQNQIQQGYYTENPELNYLRTELEQKHAQFEHLREAYQKAMTEKMSMQMEVQNLKQALTYYQHQEQQKKKSQKKEMAIQTEPAVLTARDMPIIDINGVPTQLDPRLLAAESLVSSQWSDSTGSAAISMDPPNVTTALNSDESTSQHSKSLKKNPFSRAFMTSQRILQTLANITHGKKRSGANKSPKPLPKNAVKPSAFNRSETVLSDGRSASKKRKATDTMEISSAAQPFKIPHILRSGSEERGGASRTEEQQSDDLNNQKSDGANEKGSENNKDDDESEVEEMHEDDEVKVFVYPEDEAGREHSFLIQAKEVTNNPRPGVRECGPYLLGNVEVYMTEMNGTINIWGKEMSQDSVIQNIEELEASVRSKDLKPGFRWQSTPRIYNNQGSSSTSKKCRVQSRFSHHQKSHHSCDVNNAVDCETCNPCHHRVSWPSCNHSAHENLHNCCAPTIRIDESHCGCNTSKSCCNSQRFVDVRRFSMPNVNQSCCSHNHHCSPRNLQPEEATHRHQPFVRRHSFNHTDEEEEEEEEVFEDAEENGQNSTLKLNHSQRESSPHSCSYKLVPPSGSRKRRRSSGGQSDSSINQTESDPLISQKNAPDAPDSSKRKLGKRRVGGLLLDLLKGCGDCKSPMNKSSLQNSASIYEPSTSMHQRISCSPNQPSCSLRSADKCSSCRVRRSKTDEIEAQLEFFSQEMNKLRSRSDTLRNMLDNLRDTTDVNNI